MHPPRKYLRDSLPANAVVQCDPAGRDLPQVTDRQMGVLDPDVPHILVFRPTAPAEIHLAFREIKNAFATSQPAEASDIMTRWKMHVLIGNEKPPAVWWGRAVSRYSILHARFQRSLRHYLRG